MNGTERRTVTVAAQNQFASSFKMLETLADVCRDDVWRTYYNGLPFWYHAWHVAYFIDYWLRDHSMGGGGDFRVMAFDEQIPPEFERDVGPDLFISREEIKEYLRLLHGKTDRFFEGLDDARLAEPALDGREDMTYADIILCQIRHIMYNIGYLNGILRSLGQEESDWYGYNEDDD